MSIHFKLHNEDKIKSGCFLGSLNLDAILLHFTDEKSRATCSKQLS